ncbi:hypothetical protein JZ751_022896 [Albula glossodonta]|uniref:Uncharacterized protein n=1 Tax=Albula glossodonta TaxID=121402 RepID=A0A8T2PGH3_9TELE|nr:hypothetical protein JZ751_022896 [Albula glossodonta]
MPPWRSTDQQLSALFAEEPPDLDSDTDRGRETQHFRMTIGRPMLCVLILLPLCCPVSPRQRGALNFSHSFRFTRRIRAHVQELLLQYKEQQLGDWQYEDRTLVLQTLPSINTDYSHLVRMQDSERLSVASKDLQTFLVHLDMRRQQMEREKSHHRGKRRPGLTQAMLSIQKDLKDLIRQINSQLGRLNSTTLSHAPSSSVPLPQPPPTPLLPLQDLWSSRQLGYIILRDLERYLGKLARDFIILRTCSTLGLISSLSERGRQRNDRGDLTSDYFLLHLEERMYDGSFDIRISISLARLFLN